MNYNKIYKDFIADRRKKKIPYGAYFEKHHILPRSYGGSNESGNIIKLTAEDHFFCHRLLAKIHGGKMWSALFLMCHGRSNSARGVSVINRRSFANIRAEYSKQNSAQFSGAGNPNFGKTHSSETREKISNSRKKYKAGLHPRAINISFNFIHESGEKFTGTHFEIAEKHGLTVGGARKLCNGSYYSYKGWRVPSVGRKNKRSGINCSTADQKVYQWSSEEHGNISATRCYMVENYHLTSGCLWALVNGKTKKHKGWSVKSGI